MEFLGDYRIRRLIGEGGMGKVYEAEERLSGRPVALKVLRGELAKSEEGRRLFLNEMTVLAQLEHPALVRSLASLEIDGQLVLVLELVSGRTLRDELNRRGALPWEEALDHAIAIAAALGAAHEHVTPIVHRDLKPENVMLTVSGGDATTAPPAGIKVMDFGLAKIALGTTTQHSQSAGTLQYMSPEQIDARPVDARSDLYALGLVFYEMLAGHPPFRSVSARELLNLQCVAEPPPLPDEVRRSMPRGVRDVLHALLAKDPEGRPRSAAAVIDRLAPFRPDEPREARGGAGQASEREASRGDTTIEHEPHGGARGPSSERASGSAHPSPARVDTVAVLEGAGGAASHTVARRKAVAIVSAVALIAFGATYGVRLALREAPASDVDLGSGAVR